MLPEERAQSDRPFADRWPRDSWPDVPTTVLAGEADRLLPPDLQAREAHERLGLDLGLVPGGHLNALSRPEELAARLLA